MQSYAARLAEVDRTAATLVGILSFVMPAVGKGEVCAFRHILGQRNGSARFLDGAAGPPHGFKALRHKFDCSVEARVCHRENLQTLSGDLQQE